MLVLIYDTETTGLVKGLDYTDPNMPFLASITTILYDDEAHRVVSSINAMVQPDGWTMPEEAGRVNGLTDEVLRQLGVPSPALLPTCIALMFKADLRVAHNVDFDSKVIAAALWRHVAKESSAETAHETVKAWLALPSYCTMQESKNFVKALDKRGRIKYPKLTEAYKFFFDKELDRAHSANADAVAALEIYLALNR
ncbi:MAG: 3'-5' exonuclease [Candidatus Competibacteraceae bacterium]|nr:3'-5' exonuclease [Candidatus Competibacteraceae bacterium]